MLSTPLSVKAVPSTASVVKLLDYTSRLSLSLDVWLPSESGCRYHDMVLSAGVMAWTRVWALMGFEFGSQR